MTRVAYRAARLLDGLGGAPVRDGAVLVEGERIAAVGPAADVLGHDHALVELGDVTLLPGLVDCHVHLCWGAEAVPHEVVDRSSPARTALRMARQARLTLERGVTTARDLGCTGALSVDLAAAIEAGDVPGPRLHCCGRAICATGGHAWQLGREADGPDEVRKAVRSEIKHGARLIKLMASGGVYGERESLYEPQFTLDELRAAVEEAHRFGLHVAAHAYAPVPINLALDAGVDCIEHGALLDEPTARRMAALGTYLCPTLTAPELMRRNAAGVGAPPHVLRKSKVVREGSLRAAALALEHGIRLVGGTDAGGAGIYHGTLAEEAILLTRAGASPTEAVRICTSAGAELLGLDHELGRLQAGYAADLLAVAGDVADDVAALKDVRLVVKDGAVAFAAAAHRGQAPVDATRIAATVPA